MSDCPGYAARTWTSLRRLNRLGRVRRGDIVTVAGGVCAGQPGPALIIQDDRFDVTDSVTICPFTTTEVDAALLRVPVTADEENGLGRDSFLMVDKVATVRRSNADTVVGRLGATTLVEFERRLLVFLGFGAWTSRRIRRGSEPTPAPPLRPAQRTAWPAPPPQPIPRSIPRRSRSRSRWSGRPNQVRQRTPR